jgi:hypothetical protein
MAQKRDFSKEPDQNDPRYKSDAAYENALRDYRYYRRARYVWPQISLEERVWILEETDARDPGAKAPLDFDHLNPTQKQIRFIAKYPRTRHRREIYQAKLKASPRAKDVYVERHERKLKAGP